MLQEQQPPEVCRTPLQQLCLTVKTRFGNEHKLLDVLGQMLTPPAPSAIMSSVGSLSSLGALDGDEALTALGRLLSQIPMDPRLAKTCIFACMLRSAQTSRHQVCFGMLLYTDRPLAYNITSLVAPLSNGQLMVSTGTKASNTDLAHTTSTKAVKAACEDCWHAMI